MTNLEYLEKVKKEDAEFDADNRNRGMSEIEFRKAKALEIIAENSIEIKEELNIIANCQKLGITRKL